MLLHSKEKHSDLHSFILAQEAHGDWFAVEHNSAVADNLSQKYGKTKMWLCVQHYVWILCQQCLELFDKKIVYTTVLSQLKLASFLKPPLQEFLWNIFLSYLPSEIFFSGVSGIPCLVVCKKDGTLVTKEGRSGVTGMVIVIFASWSDYSSSSFSSQAKSSFVSSW